MRTRFRPAPARRRRSVDRDDKRKQARSDIIHIVFAANPGARRRAFNGNARPRRRKTFEERRQRFIRSLFRPTVRYVSTNQTRRDFGSATSQRRVKYTEILSFSMFSRHFAFNVDKHGYREKILKTTRTVRLLVQLDCGNT